MISTRIYRSLLLLLLLGTAAFAQSPAPSSPQNDDQRKAQKELQGKAIGLLDDVIKDSESFKHAENRIRVRVAAANILWDHDEARARILIKDAMANLADLLKNLETGDAPENFKTFEGPRQLRGEILMMLGQRDPRLAREFLRATRGPGPQPGTVRTASPDQQLENNLAMQIASVDPKGAVEMVEENLASGLSYDLPQILSALHQKDPEAAAKLAGEVLTKIRAENLESNHVARQVAVALLRDANEAQGGEGGDAAKGATPILDQQALRDLTELIAVEALRSSSSAGPELLNTLREMMPVVERYAPARAVQLKKKFGPTAVTGEKVADEEDFPAISGMNARRYSELFEKGTVDELLAEAAKAPEGVREGLYQQAVMKLVENGEEARARQVVDERVKDPEQRKQMLSLLDELAVRKAAEQGKIEQTRKLLATLRTNEERVRALAQLATGAAAKGEKKVALQLLEEARGMMGGRAKNFNQLGAQLEVARAYAQLDVSRSLAILEPIVDQLNELLAAAIVLGGFMTEEIVNDDEIMMGPLAMLANEMLVRYLDDVKTLATADFERTKALADKFLRDEIRISARLLIAQSILSPRVPQADAKFTMIETMKP
ncbi:MAG TPA: hypothetical protein VM095_09615 [Pyrinomonadaceae bacterium]|nr:hypothetical protein [Pyrinomonadaceae bacterium]